MPTKSAGCPSVRMWAVALLCVFTPLVGSLRAQTLEPRSVVRLAWLTDLGAEALAGSEKAPRAVRGPFVAVAPGAAYSLALEADAKPQKRIKLAADSAIPYGAAVNGDSIVLASSDGSVSMWRELEALQWRRSLGERAMSVGWDGGDAVWVATRSGRLHALASADGEDIWTVDIGGRAEGSPVRDGASVYVATKRNALFCIDAAAGKIRWKVELPGPVLHPPVVTGDEPRLVVAATWDGHLAAFDTSGEPLWSVELSDRLSGAPVAAEGSDDFVAAVSSDGTVQVYELSGELRWRRANAADGAADLLIHEQLVVVSNVLEAFDLQTGAPLADYPEGAVLDLKQRFLDAMIEGERAFTETEKAAIIARESFPIAGRLFGEARVEDDTLLFTTEDGWIYFFDASSLRPLSRYRSGQRAHVRPLLTSQAVVVASSDEVFGLDPDSGDMRWRRTLGEVEELAAGSDALAVIADERLSVLDLSSGNRLWRARGEFQSVCAPASEGSLWLAVSSEDRLEWFDPLGNRVGTPLDLGAEIVSVVPTTPRRWAVATGDGKVLVLSQLERYGASDSDGGTELSTSWEVLLDEPARRMSIVDDILLVDSDSDYVVGLAEIDGRELWRLPLEEGARYQLEPGTSTMIVFHEDTLGVYDVVSGEPAFTREVSSPAVGASLRGDRLLWLDHAGRAHETTWMTEGDTASAHLGAYLDQAFSTTDGFVVTTAAGEVGLAVIESDGSQQEDER